MNPTPLLNAIRNSGDREVPATWVAEHRDQVHLVDVREPHELTGPLGHIADGDSAVENIPLLRLLSNTSMFDPEEPLVLVCRSGRRSGQAVDALVRSGFRNVASIEGGMIAWNTEVLGHSDILADETAANTANLDDALSRANGLPEVSAAWVAENIGRFRLIDVRELGELQAEGMVAQAEHIPLDTFMEAAQDLDRDAPFVVMCRSGGRSGRVVRALEAGGFRSVASLEGGMIAWKASGLPVHTL